MKSLFFFSFLILSIALASCASTSKSAPSPLVSQSLARRLTKPDMNRKSIYDQDMKTSLNTKKGGTDSLSRKTFTAKKFNGDKTFTQTPKFKTNEFTSGKNKNHFGTEKFSQSDKKPSYATQSYATKKSWFSNKTSNLADKNYSKSTEVYKTSANRDALKSQQKNDRPKIIELESRNKKPAYTEDQVKKLMGRD